jgi:hypothetical protein
MLLQEAFRASGKCPDAVISAHAHHYQRLTYTFANGRQIPFLIAGGGGHSPIEPLSTPCAKNGKNGASPPSQGKSVVFPEGLSVPDGDRIELAAHNDMDLGFLRITLDGAKRTLTGEYFVVSNSTASSSSSTKQPALDDSFTLDLKAHRVK